MSVAPKKEETGPAVAVPSNLLAGVRYSLPEMLAELKIERAADFFAMEKLEQDEIKKLFNAKAPRRVRLKK